MHPQNLIRSFRLAALLACLLLPATGLRAQILWDAGTGDWFTASN